ncbi:DUF421 domain-containing protein [Paenibacillus pinistramenti]|uniref:DUF421 domain-containing protein n=1 Tax=Paenibacillus pinistramenti TaxID=1768003 RepID=UPI001EF023EE|nr:YetF domain-containing protein [Paenibacillus pinistramenti]
MLKVIWETLIIAAAGLAILRISGRKSISQMTIPQVAILLVVGTVLGSEVAGKGLFHSILASALFLMILIITEWIALKWNTGEILMKGRSVVVIQDGQLVTANMSRLRLTADDVEKRLRMLGISRIEDVKTATIENNGELGYELMPQAKPVTMGDLERILKENFQHIQVTKPAGPAVTIFTELSGPSKEPPPGLH